jgi:hypothetical protein
MSSLTVSNSGTAWIKDMHDQGKKPEGGWANSPKAAYYASLDLPGVAAGAQAPSLPQSLEELLKLQQSAVDDSQIELADQLQRQISKVAAENGLSSSGNRIDVSV